MEFNESRPQARVVRSEPTNLVLLDEHGNYQISYVFVIKNTIQISTHKLRFLSSSCSLKRREVNDCLELTSGQ